MTEIFYATDYILLQLKFVSYFKNLSNILLVYAQFLHVFRDHYVTLSAPKRQD